MVVPMLVHKGIFQEVQCIGKCDLITLIYLLTTVKDILCLVIDDLGFIFGFPCFISPLIKKCRDPAKIHSVGAVFWSDIGLVQDSFFYVIIQ